MALIVTVEVDEERLRRTWLGTSEENVLTELDALRMIGKPPERGHWLPMRNLRCAANSLLRRIGMAVVSTRPVRINEPEGGDGEIAT
jgi:hypothetical protein